MRASFSAAECRDCRPGVEVERLAEVNVYGGQIKKLASNGTKSEYNKVNLYGGSFGTSAITNASAGATVTYASGYSLVPSGAGGEFPYVLAPTLTRRANARLSDSLTFYMYFPTANAFWTYYDGTFTDSVPNTAVKAPDSTVNVTVGERAVNGLAVETEGDYYKVAIPVYAKEMGEDVTVCFTSGGAALRTATDSMKAYAQRIIADPTSEAESTLMVDMLVYGAAAQQYFGHNTESLATADVDVSGATVVDWGSFYNEMDTTHTPAYHSANLKLEERVDFAMYFWANLVDTEQGYTVKVNGETVVENGSFDTYLDSDNQNLYKVSIPSMTIGDMSDAVIEVTYRDLRAGSSMTAKDTMANYLYRNVGLDIDDAPHTYLKEGTLVEEATGNDTSELYAKLMAFASGAASYASTNKVG